MKRTARGKRTPAQLRGIFVNWRVFEPLRDPAYVARVDVDTEAGTIS
jgi:hypothetical protein